jgi:ATP-dependent Lhr-like helicase
MEEAFKEALEKDLDLPNTRLVLNQLGREIEVSFAPASKDPTPIARIGIERISRRTDLIPPEKMKRILIESAKVRILNESRLLACPSCLNYAEIVRVKDMPENFECPRCNSTLGVSTDTPDSIEKIRKKRILSESDKRTIDGLKASSLLIKKNGKIAAYVLAGRRMSATDVRAVLRRTRRVSDRLFEQIMEQEKKALRRRFW